MKQIEGLFASVLFLLFFLGSSYEICEAIPQVRRGEFACSEEGTALGIYVQKQSIFIQQWQRGGGRRPREVSAEPLCHSLSQGMSPVHKDLLCCGNSNVEKRDLSFIQLQFVLISEPAACTERFGLKLLTQK